ncbi:MAG: hypothetical protein ABSA46_15685 [Thermodesulfovibrionales bacterium]|jgi:hypothetical protein
MPELRRILLVEDDPNDIELIMTGLSENKLAALSPHSKTTRATIAFKLDQRAHMNRNLRF